jgi:hypothetical protein
MNLFLWVEALKNCTNGSAFSAVGNCSNAREIKN